MDPVFTLQWPEFVLANRLQKLLPKTEGYSVLIPTSRQEKGIDLAVLKKRPNGMSQVVTIQIKASRTYTPEQPKRQTTLRYRFYTWFNSFPVPDEADFFLLFGMYAPEAERTRPVGAKWYKDCTLLFTRQEMKDFISSCLTVKNTPDGKFAFAFNDLDKVVQTRGDSERRSLDFTDHLLDNRIALLKEKLSTQPSAAIDADQ